jgi:hypothetical protein
MFGIRKLREQVECHGEQISTLFEDSDSNTREIKRLEEKIKILSESHMSQRRAINGKAVKPVKKAVKK